MTLIISGFKFHYCNPGFRSFLVAPIELRHMKTSRQKKGRKKNAKHEDFFRAIIDGMQCGVISVDTSGQIIKMNEIAKRILDIDGEKAPLRKRERIEGKEISDVLSAHPRLSRLMLGSFEMSTLPNRDEMEISSRDGKRKKIGYSIAVVKNRTGKNIGCTIFFKDLTRIEQKAEQEQLKERLAALGHMSASLAHELRNPIAAIEVNASFLKRKLTGDSDAKKILEGVMSDISRLKITINESLSFVKPLELNLRPSQYEKTIEHAISSSIMHNDTGTMQIVRRLERIEDSLFDPDLVMKALINVFRNAVDAMNGSGRIEIELKKIGNGKEWGTKETHSSIGSGAGTGNGFARIRIRDYGKGISRDIIDKIFYPFFTTKDEGSGLGLSFTKKVIDAHKGIIDVESTVGSGTTFTIQLPIIHSSKEL